MQTFADVIDKFPSAEALATEIGEKGVTVRAWRQRKSVPPRYWSAIANAAQRNGIEGVTVEALCSIATSEPHQREAG
jgi:hypothetical protein